MPSFWVARSDVWCSLDCSDRNALLSEAGVEVDSGDVDIQTTNKRRNRRRQKRIDKHTSDVADDVEAAATLATDSLLSCSDSDDEVAG